MGRVSVGHHQHDVDRFIRELPPQPHAVSEAAARLPQRRLLHFLRECGLLQDGVGSSGENAHRQLHDELHLPAERQPRGRHLAGDRHSPGLGGVQAAHAQRKEEVGPRMELSVVGGHPEGEGQSSVRGLSVRWVLLRCVICSWRRVHPLHYEALFGETQRGEAAQDVAEGEGAAEDRDGLEVVVFDSKESKCKKIGTTWSRTPPPHTGINITFHKTRTLFYEARTGAMIRPT